MRILFENSFQLNGRGKELKYSTTQVCKDFHESVFKRHAKTEGSLMPRPFKGPKMFWASPNFLCQTKNLFTYCGSHKHFVPDKKMICIQ